MILLRFQAVKAHIPQIKFRKGSLAPAPATHATETSYTPASVVAASIPSAEPTKWKGDQVANLEWWQTPTKFKRRGVDDLEVDLINVRSYLMYCFNMK